jgi:hypothetical protein
LNVIAQTLSRLFGQIDKLKRRSAFKKSWRNPPSLRQALSKDFTVDADVVRCFFPGMRALTGTNSSVLTEEDAVITITEADLGRPWPTNIVI